MPRKQNAVVAACSIGMLLLLGLYILDLNNAFARSSTLAAHQSQTQTMYRHPIVAYEKLTALGANQLRADYPLEHYQAQPSSQLLTPPPVSSLSQTQSPLTDDFNNIPLLGMPPQLAPFSHPNGHYTGPHSSQLSGRMQQQQQRHPALFAPRPPPPPIPLPLATPSPHNKPQEKKIGQPSNIQMPLTQPSLQVPPSTIPILTSQQQQQQPITVSSQSLGAAAATQTPTNSTQAPTTTSPLFYSEDSDHPVKEIMRAIETFSVDRPLEQLFPQSLVQLHLASAAFDGRLSSPAMSFRQVLLDSLQPSVSVLVRQQQLQPQQHSPINLDSLFPSANYEALCRSTAYITHPKKAKSLTGQWKTIVNLPGHKYRGVAISQMVRIEECSSQTIECVATMPSSLQQTQQQSQQTHYQPSYLPRSQCLQQYGNQQLVAWTPQLGLHIDIFRFPNACSCHIKRI